MPLHSFSLHASARKKSLHNKNFEDLHRPYEMNSSRCPSEVPTKWNKCIWIKKKKKNLSKFSSKHICPTFCRSSPITPRRPHDSLFVPVVGAMFFFWSPNCFAAYVNGTSLLRENQTNLTILMRNENRICSPLNCFQTEGQSDLKHSHWSGISKLIMKQIWWDIDSF